MTSKRNIAPATVCICLILLVIWTFANISPIESVKAANIATTASSTKTSSKIDSAIQGFGLFGFFVIALAIFVILAPALQSKDRAGTQGFDSEVYSAESLKDFRRKDGRKFKKSLIQRLKEAIHPTPMQQKLSDCLFHLRVQQRKLERTSYHLQQRDQSLYGRYVLAVQGKNTPLAEVYAKECEELRRGANIVLLGEIALRQANSRLELIRNINTPATMLTVAHVARKLVPQLEGLIPDVTNELSEASETLEELAKKLTEKAEAELDMQSVKDDAEKILLDAKAVAEKQMKERFPELPSIPAPA